VNKIIDADVGYGRYYSNDDWSVADRDGDSKQSEYGLDLEASWLIEVIPRFWPVQWSQAQTVRAIPARREE